MYFVITNGLGADWLDDLRLVARFNRRFFLVAGSGGKATKTMLIGALESSERRTLELVAEVGEVTGAEVNGGTPKKTSGRRDGITG